MKTQEVNKIKGLFIPEITAEMFRNGCLESIEALMAEGEIYDIEYDLHEPGRKKGTSASQWVPCSKKLPKINQNVILSLTDGTVSAGSLTPPERIWQVTGEYGEKLWVYDPESYTDNIDSLPTAKAYIFCEAGGNAPLSVTSVNYDGSFPGVNAWMPLPKPYGGEQDE